MPCFQWNRCWSVAWARLVRGAAVAAASWGSHLGPWWPCLVVKRWGPIRWFPKIKCNKLMVVWWIVIEYKQIFLHENHPSNKFWAPNHSHTADGHLVGTMLGYLRWCAQCLPKAIQPSMSINVQTTLRKRVSELSWDKQLTHECALLLHLTSLSVKYLGHLVRHLMQPPMSLPICYGSCILCISKSTCNFLASVFYPNFYCCNIKAIFYSPFVAVWPFDHQVVGG